MDYGLNGKVVLVTGGGRGVGQAIAAAYAQHGAAVVIADIVAARGEQTASSIRAAGGAATAIQTDVSSPASVDALMAHLLAQHGRLDIACNNAAIETEQAPLAEVDDATFDAIAGVNLKGVFLGMKRQIRQMLTQQGGVIVNIASINAVRPQTIGAVYSATKAAVVSLTQSAALAYTRHNIRINAVLPGAFDSPLVDEKLQEVGLRQSDIIDALSLCGRIGRLPEIANAVLWLSSDLASYTFGHALAVDGGYLSR